MDERKTINLILCLVLIGIWILLGSKAYASVKVSSRQMQVPVLKFKKHNPAFSHANECAVVELSDGSLMLNMRHGGAKPSKRYRAVSVTKDLGQIWSEHPTSRNTLKEPVCMGSLHKHVYIQDGQKKSILRFSNPNISKKPRRKTTIKVSFDESMTRPE